MGIPINWKPTTASLHDIHTHLTAPEEGWPEPDVDVPPITSEQRRRARRRWTERVRATYVSSGLAASLLQRLIALGAPVEVLTGAAYTSEELTLQLTVNLHILDPLKPPSSLSAPVELSPRGSAKPRWGDVFARSLDFFVFNLTLSRPVYQALYVVSSDHAISELSGLMADNLGELNSFGELAIQWMQSAHFPTVPSSLVEKIPLLFAAYEALFHGTPEMLDSLAGREITVEPRPGNLGTLSSPQLAAIFYDTLQSEIFPRLEALGVDPSDAWKRRHLARRNAAPPAAVAAAVGLSLPDHGDRSTSPPSSIS